MASAVIEVCWIAAHQVRTRMVWNLYFSSYCCTLRFCGGNDPPPRQRLWGSSPPQFRHLRRVNYSTSLIRIINVALLLQKDWSCVLIPTSSLLVSSRSVWTLKSLALPSELFGELYLDHSVFKVSTRSTLMIFIYIINLLSTWTTCRHIFIRTYILIHPCILGNMGVTTNIILPQVLIIHVPIALWQS